MIAVSLTKLLWIVIMVNGDVAGVLHDEPMPDYMSMADCLESVRQQDIQPVNIAMGYTFRCVQSYGRPLTTGKYYEELE